MLNEEELSIAIKTEAVCLGFSHIGIAPALPLTHYETFIRWIQAGQHASMGYLARQDTLVKRGDPQLILEGCQRIICLAMPYRQPQTPLSKCPPGTGRISAYARTQDYHEVIWNKLDQLENLIHSKSYKKIKTKSYVDTGPILERSYASLAGLGIAGKNSSLIIKGYGSYFFLAEILTDLELPVDQAFTQELCGTCEQCIEACPTGCIGEDRTIDAGRCLSYLTIENKGKIPDDLKPLIGNWVFGCDICQMACPHNSRTPEQPIALGDFRLPECLDLLALFSYDENAFTNRFGKTPIVRAKRQGMLRNAAVVLGNQRYQPALPILIKTLTTENNPAVEDACAWAITQIQSVN